MKCVLCPCSNISLLKLQTYIDNKTLKEIPFVLPDFIFLELQGPLYACTSCSQQLTDFYEIKNICLKNLSLLKQRKDILTKTSDVKFNELNIVINYKEGSAKYHTDKKFKNKSNYQGVLSPEAEEKDKDGDQLTEKYSISSSQLASLKKQFKCNVCHKTFNLRSRLEEHACIHTEKLLYNCPMCQKTFTQYSNLLRHKHIHTGGKSYECEFCHRTFTQHGDLNRHKLIHTGEKPHECDVCHKTFARFGDLNRHKLVHTGEKPYKCEVCHKTFTQIGHLNTHKFIHTGEKPYECDICHKPFTDKSNLVRHKRTHKA